MTPEQLRADAARLEALAKAATNLPWYPGDDCDDLSGHKPDLSPKTKWWYFTGPLGGKREVRAGHNQMACSASTKEIAKHIVANDPTATLRRVAEMRLLADAMDAARDWICDDAGDNRHRAALLARFTATEAPDGDL